MSDWNPSDDYFGGVVISFRRSLSTETCANLVFEFCMHKVFFLHENERLFTPAWVYLLLKGTPANRGL